MPKFITDPEKFRKLNGWLTWVWIVMIPVAILTGWIKSVEFISAISIYALVTGHLATWQAARVEVNQEQSNDTDFEKIETKVDEVHDEMSSH